MVNSAKAILLSEKIKTNTQANIISQFDELFVSTNKVKLNVSFSDLIYQIKVYPPTKEFALNYIESAETFLKTLRAYREKDIATL